MQNRRFFLSLIALPLLAAGCDSKSLDTNSAAEAPAVQVQSAEVIFRDGQYYVAPENKVELLPQAINTGGALPYPKRTGFEIKSLSTDFWPNRQQMVDAGVSGTVVNLVWENWQPTQQSQCTPNQISFEGQCYTIETAFDHQIKYWSGQGKNVSAVLYGVPSWARDYERCPAASTDSGKFCSARNPQDYARFVAMIAERYNGLNGHGRIVDFIIHNEVNMNQWYKVACGDGIPCDQEQWIADYAANFNAAYDRVVAVQPDARVMVPFAHQFDTNFDNPHGSNPIISVKTFLRGVHARAQGRKWRIAYHPYNHHLSSAENSFDDLPRVTFGNIGVLSGWLRQEFPMQPESWEVHLTENGVSSNGRSDEYSQDVAVCNSYANVLGTPGIENYIYHRMQDNNYEAVRGAAFGLHREDGSPKPVWETWKGMTGHGNNTLKCGFENLPYTKLASSAGRNGEFRASTRVVGDSYSEVDSWYLLRDHAANTYMAYECRAGNSSYVSTDMYCGGELSYGPVGYVHEYDAQDRVALFTCSNGTSVYSSDTFSCGSDTVVEFIGYVKNSR